MIIFSDVNLDSITILSNGRSIAFRIIDSIKGDLLSHIVCKSIYLFHYNNIFEEDDGFACYIGEITCTTIKENEIGQWLEKNNSPLISMKNVNGLP